MNRTGKTNAKQGPKLDYNAFKEFHDGEIEGHSLASFMNYSGMDSMEEPAWQANAGAAICKEAMNEHASLVVVGSRGAGVVRRTILGSVSSYVVHHAHVPVLVCPKPHSGHY